MDTIEISYYRNTIKPIIYASFLMLSILKAQQSDTLWDFKRNCKYGYINSKGEEVVPPIYDKGFTFQEGLAGVCINNKCGFINTKGEVVIPLRYFDVGEFHHGRTFVRDSSDSEYYFIDMTGNIPQTSPFSSRFYMPDNWDYYYDQKQKKYGVRDYKTKTDILLPKYESIQIEKDFTIVKINNKCGVVNSKGKMLFKPEMYYDISEFHEGIAQFVRSAKSKTFGYIDTNGIVVIKDTLKKYSEFEIGSQIAKGRELFHHNSYVFSEKLAVRYDKDKFGYIDLKGIWVIKPIYDQALPFSEGLARVKIKGKWGMIDQFGKVEIDFKYDSLFVPFEGLIGFKFNGKWGFMNSSEEIIVTPEYDSIWYYFGSLATCLKKGMFSDYFQKNCDDSKIDLYYVNKKGKVVWSSKK